MKETITVLARAIPEESEKYGRLVCVAGLNEQNEWRRIYPYPLNKISFSKRDRIAVEVGANRQDVRKESRKVKSTQVVGQATPLEVANRLNPIVTSIAKLEASKSTLGVIKPDLIDIKIEVNSTELLDAQTYLSTVAEEGIVRKEKVKLPVKVSYVFSCRDAQCGCAKKPHKITVIDWEVNELARNIMEKDKDKQVIAGKLKEKLFDWMKTREFYLIMGTHFRFATWLIVGFFYPDKDTAAQRTLPT